MYKEYSAILYGVINGIVKETREADRLLKQTFDDICTNIGQYDPLKCSFLTWAIQLARSTSIDYLRSTKQADPGYLTENNLPVASVELIMIPSTTIGRSENDIFAMVLQGYNVGEVAKKLDMSVELVKMSVRKAMLFKTYRA